MKHRILRRTVSAFLILAVAAFIRPLPVQAGGGTLNIGKLAQYEKGANIPKAVRDECGLETKIIEFVQKYAEKNFDKIVLVNNASANTAGRTLSITITDALAPKGGTTTGYKSLTIKGTLWQNGKVQGTFTARRVTSGGASFIGYKGTCSMLSRCAKTLGKDVATWLEKPAMNAKLGDAR